MGNRSFVHSHPKLVMILVIAIVVLASLALVIAWEAQYECVDWAIRIETGKWGPREVHVCVQTRPRWGENIGR